MTRERTDVGVLENAERTDRMLASVRHSRSAIDDDPAGRTPFEWLGEMTRAAGTLSVAITDHWTASPPPIDPDLSGLENRDLRADVAITHLAEVRDRWIDVAAVAVAAAETLTDAIADQRRPRSDSPWTDSMRAAIAPDEPSAAETAALVRAVAVDPDTMAVRIANRLRGRPNGDADL